MWPGRPCSAALEKLGDVDSLQFPTYAPDVLGLLWLAPMKIPGRDLPEDSQWQMDEQVRIQPEDYDRILEMGWSPWFGEYIGKYLGAAAAAGQALQEAGPRWTMEYMKQGYVIFSPLTVDHPSSIWPAAARSRSSPSTSSRCRTRSRRSSM